jgi:hypothetical protein
MSNQFKPGDKVIHNNIVRTIYAIYDNENVSLCLIDDDDYEYDDIEEDFTTPISELKITQ